MTEKTLREIIESGDIMGLQDLIFDDVDSVLNERFEEDSSPLHAATWFGKYDMAEELLDAGALLEDMDNVGATPLHYAVWRNDVSLVNLFIARGADIQKRDKKGNNILHLAARKGHKGITTKLIGMGLSVHSADNNGNTALHKAASEGRTAMVKDLLEWESSPYALTDDGMTALHVASLGGHMETVEALLEGGSALEAVDNIGRTPYHCACVRNNLETILLLVERGCNIEAVTHDGRTGPQCCVENEARDSLQNQVEGYLKKKAKEEKDRKLKEKQMRQLMEEAEENRKLQEAMFAAAEAERQTRAESEGAVAQEAPDGIFLTSGGVGGDGTVGEEVISAAALGDLQTSNSVEGGGIVKAQSSDILTDDQDDESVMTGPGVVDEVLGEYADISGVGKVQNINGVEHKGGDQDGDGERRTQQVGGVDEVLSPLENAAEVNATISS